MDSPSAEIIAAVIAAIAATAGAVLTVVFNFKSLRERRAAQKRKQLNAALRLLLMPLHSRLSAMHAVFRIFAADKPKEFRTLEYLLDPDNYTVEGKSRIELSEADQILLSEIVKLGEEIEALVLSKGSLVDDPVLQKDYTPDPTRTDVPPDAIKGMGLFPLLVAHLRVFRLAHQGALKSNPAPYRAFVYPREVNQKVYDAIQRTQAELAKLG